MTSPQHIAETPGPPAASLDRVLLATDLGQTSAAAEEWAIGLTARLGAELIVVSVIDVEGLRLPGGRYGRRVDQVRSEREGRALDLVTRARRAGVRARFLIWEGDPGESIVDAAVSEGASITVVGSHGRGSLGRLLLGSVSDHLVKHSPCPVVVIRPDETAGTEPVPRPIRPTTSPDSLA
jgi:nucleotide-binding universal stress UspA family protein